MTTQQMFAFVSLLALAANGCSAQPQGPWYQQVSRGPAFKVQYVRLTGHEADPAQNTALMRKTYDACATAFRAVGHRVAPLPPEGFPSSEFTVVKESYYAPGKTALYTHQMRTYVDYKADCALTTSNSYSLNLYDFGGRCQIDLAHHTGDGVCLAGQTSTRQARAQSAGSTSDQTFDWDKIPEPQRTQLKEQFAKLGMNRPAARTTKAMSLPAPPKTGARKTIAGIDCAMFEQPVGPQVWKFCATDSRSVPRPVADIVPSDLARTIPGAVLEADTVHIHLRATTFIADLEVPSAVFEIPPGTRYFAH